MPTVLLALPLHEAGARLAVAQHPGAMPLEEGLDATKILRVDRFLPGNQIKEIQYDNHRSAKAHVR